jgi:predicted acetyltransferase
VRYADPDTVAAHAPDIHRRWAARTPAAISRDAAWWRFLITDPVCRRGSVTTPLRYLLHADGYAAYRATPDLDTIRVSDLFAATDAAYAALWRVLLGVDLVHTVAAACPLDDPLPHLLTDPRLVRTTALEDGLWARFLDVPAVLAARRYPVELDLVLDVRDEFLGRGGRFHLRGGPDGADCTRTAAAPHAALDIATLASLYFGAHRAATLARAGLLDAAPDTVARCDLAFTATREPHHGTGF